MAIHIVIDPSNIGGLQGKKKEKQKKNTEGLTFSNCRVTYPDMNDTQQAPPALHMLSTVITELILLGCVIATGRKLGLAESVVLATLQHCVENECCDEENTLALLKIGNAYLTGPNTLPVPQGCATFSALPVDLRRTVPAGRTALAVAVARRDHNDRERSAATMALIQSYLDAMQAVRYSADEAAIVDRNMAINGADIDSACGVAARVFA